MTLSHPITSKKTRILNKKISRRFLHSFLFLLVAMSLFLKFNGHMFLIIVVAVAGVAVEGGGCCGNGGGGGVPLCAGV